MEIKYYGISTILWAILVGIGSFAIFEYQNISLGVANMTENMSVYLGDSDEIKRYNEALWLAHAGDFTGAESLLFPLIHTQGNYRASVYELYGDTLYMLSGSIDEVVFFYRHSLEQQYDLRVEKKIQLLQSIIAPKGDQDSSVANDISASGSSSGEILRESIRYEIQHTQDNSMGLINLDQDSDILEKERIREIFSRLGTGAEVMDW